MPEKKSFPSLSDYVEDGMTRPDLADIVNMPRFNRVKLHYLLIKSWLRQARTKGWF
jgi:hypothetical protein